MSDQKSPPSVAPAAPATAPVDIEAIKAQVLDGVKDQVAQVLAEAQEQAAQIIAEAQKEADEIKEYEVPDKPPDNDAYLNEYVDVKLFKDNKYYKDDVFVSVNGETCLIKRGIPVKIKRKFAILLEASDRQDLEAAELAEKYANEYRDKEKQFT